MYYFTYGSNMDEDDLGIWCKKQMLPFPQWEFRGTAYLKNYKLVFNYFSESRSGGAANLVVLDESIVYGLLFKVNEADLDTIRKKEGFPRYYEEILVTVINNEKSISDVITFKVVNSREKQQHQPPTKHYMGLILKNAVKYDFPLGYIESLKSIVTF